VEYEVLLICNGDLPSLAKLQHLAGKAKVIVAADGGSNQAVKFGVFPHVVVGDLDSITEETKAQLPDATLVKIHNQDFCDIEKALDYIVAENYRKVLVVGMEGKRFDFTLSNFSVIWNYVGALDMEFLGEGWKAYPLKGKQSFDEPVGTVVSLIPFGPSNGIALKGLKYPLSNASYDVGQTGVSNSVESVPFQTEIVNGRMLMVILQPNE